MTILKSIFLQSLLLFFLLTVQVYAQTNSNKFVVVLDAGHGGHDSGKPSKYGFKEKDVALKLALKVGKILEKHNGIKVIYTRKKDIFLELRQRAKIANQADADLFVSIHCNAHHTQAYGTETYVLGVANTKRNFDVAKQENEVIFLEENFDKNYKGYDPGKPESLIGLTLIQEEYVDQSVLLASLIETNFVKKSKRKSRGVKQASLWVMHNTYMPSVLVEAGFVTNKNEGPFLNSAKGQQTISKSIAEAIVTYKSSLDFNVGDAVPVIEKENIIIDTTTIKNTKHTNSNTQEEKIPQKNSKEIKQDSLVTDVIKVEAIDSVKIKKPKEIALEESIVFKVQIAAGPNPVKLSANNFKGLEGVTRLKTNNFYKYYYGNTTNYDTIKKMKEIAENRGYESCFLVAFKNENQISLSEALKKKNN